MLMNRRFFSGIVMSAMALAIALPSPALAADAKEQAALTLVKNIGDEAVQTLSDSSLSEAQKRDKFEKFLDDSFDMQRIGRFVLGQSWRNATDAQREEFLKVFRDFMVASYSDKIGSYSGEDLQIKDATSLNDKESLVHSTIIRPDGPPIKLDWRVRKTDSGEKIVDVIIEGISMAQTHRSEFASVVSQSGVDGLINKLKDQIKTASAS
ncbi:ABC transporter substrate-binding protein [uncultured Sneathiella sp.]|uniref:MlaC/ttg2D family ABC transporter substrate-binding protein n=1 Tax=uncultured Sneathiella sp. TaxID=879315 RepID=UPI0030EDD22F|tara:strand:- start:40444 stop:41070 length:627 start_codon:yes stop_codon:yes gene_type:complete